MSDSSRSPDDLPDKPYGLIYGALVDSGRVAAAGPPADPADPGVQASLAGFFQRLGGIPKSWPEDRAAAAVPALLRQVARQADAEPGEVTATLLRFCADGRPGAPCGSDPRCGECPAAQYCDYPDRRLTIPELPTEERPRERLLEHGADSLKLSELLAIIIRTGSRRNTALELARRLLKKFGTLRGLASASVPDLTEVRGIGPAKAAQLKAAFALARRYAAEQLKDQPTVTGSRKLFEYMKQKLRDARKEFFYTLMLDTKHHIIREDRVAVGSLSESVVHPREAFRKAVREGAAKVIFVHNHPSGNPEPSPQDRRLTRRLAEAGGLMGIQVLDHMIVGEEGYFSFAEQGLLEGGG